MSPLNRPLGFRTLSGLGRCSYQAVSMAVLLAFHHRFLLIALLHLNFASSNKILPSKSEVQPSFSDAHFHTKFSALARKPSSKKAHMAFDSMDNYDEETSFLFSSLTS